MFLYVKTLQCHIIQCDLFPANVSNEGQLCVVKYRHEGLGCKYNGLYQKGTSCFISPSVLYLWRLNAHLSYHMHKSSSETYSDSALIWVLSSKPPGCGFEFDLFLCLRDVSLGSSGGDQWLMLNNSAQHVYSLTTLTPVNFKRWMSVYWLCGLWMLLC